ncbi:MAG: adenosylcobalamin-dependent ribonucleoside-diphosphate reductase [Phycisphaerales bacterium]|jgi:ribonucleoside-diphosphate reductase alpha chain|nr:adenosylcobalamin-dependent ribonucleoside-diphosphate reductase [Phycisphaerales bacterium]MDP6890713.1 adenosylcobalamin-dependent ribonucleoside-diphosphate reductase [Phycisphaerales bacterium]
MKVTRRFTKLGTDVFDCVEWERRSSCISNADGSIVFEMKEAWIPKQWSQLATDIMVSKYFRKAGVPQVNDDGEPITDEQGEPVLGPERSARQVIHRLAGCWRAWGEKHDYFDSAEDANAFYDELCWMMLNQVAAPNSPQWFNTGLHWAYGVSGPAQGHWVNDPATGRQMLADDAYSHPQPHACFIQAVDDDLVAPGGIMDLWTREARLFKYGSGTGTNFSSLRGDDEPLSGGGRSSGLMSFLKIGDRAAGAIKSGGTTRRAAKMVCLDADHPDIEAFVTWKAREELKVAAMVEGVQQLSESQQELAEDLELNLDYDFNGEAYQTVSGQNSNNSVRLSNDFMHAIVSDGDWDLIQRTDGEVAKTLKASGLWDRICRAAWQCADPGLQFDGTINEWHTCSNDGRINASNPCSEYMFLDDTACNLASINLLKFWDTDKQTFDVKGYEHAIDIWTVVLEISVLMAAFPSRSIAERSHRYRTLGLGYANLGALLMQSGIPYDSDEGRTVAGVMSAIMTGRAYAVSAKLAEAHGAFAGFEDNRDNMLRVIRNHRRAAFGEDRDSEDWEDLDIRPVSIDIDCARSGNINIANAGELLDRAQLAWDRALDRGTKHGFRNAQVSVIAPTGTIGLLMDCDTTGVEPDFALTKFKKLAGGGYFKIANQSVRPALLSLGYTEDQAAEILRWVMGTLDLDVPMPDDDGKIAGDPSTFRDYLVDQGYNADDLATVMAQLPTVFELRFGFTAWNMPEHVLERCGTTDVAQLRERGSFDGLAALGLTPPQITTLNRLVCGTQTIEGAPHLRDEHLAVFDCANRCGPMGERFIAAEGHIQMMAAAQPFISGAISKTINLPNEATRDDISRCYRMSWELGLKANALYRDGCKLSQPLNASACEDVLDDEVEDDIDIELAREEIATEVVDAASSVVQVDYVERVVERIIERPMRRRLSDTRRSITHHFNVAGHEGYLTVGMYEEGGPGELFITMSKEGSTIGGLMDSLGTAISVALQYGVPIKSLVTKFAHQRFEPQGMTTNADIPFAKSLVDYIFRWMGMEFVEGYREANAPARPASTTTSAIKEDASCKDGRMSPDRTAASRSSENGGRASGEPSLKMDAATRRPTDPVMEPVASVTIVSGEFTAATTSELNQSNAALMGDAPPCDNCGSITVRNGTCYKCMNCGNSMGCS